MSPGVRLTKGRKRKVGLGERGGGRDTSPFPSLILVCLVQVFSVLYSLHFFLLLFSDAKSIFSFF